MTMISLVYQWNDGEDDDDLEVGLVCSNPRYEYHPQAAAACLVLDRLDPNLHMGWFLSD